MNDENQTPTIPALLINLERNVRSELEKQSRQAEEKARESERKRKESIERFLVAAVRFLADEIEEQAMLRLPIVNPVTIRASDIARFVDTIEHSMPTCSGTTNIYLDLPRHERIRIAVSWDAPRDGKLDLTPNGSKWIGVGTAYNGDDLGRALHSASIIWERNHPVNILRRRLGDEEWEPIDEVTFRLEIDPFHCADSAIELIHKNHVLVTAEAEYTLDEIGF